jgi:hypothetical protein
MRSYFVTLYSEAHFHSYSYGHKETLTQNMEFCHFVLLSVIFQFSRVSNSANTEKLKVRHPQQPFLNPSSDGGQSQPLELLHAMLLSDLSAPISSALSFLPAHIIQQCNCCTSYIF